MNLQSTAFPFAELDKKLEGDLHHNLSWRLLYATDASVFKEMPAAVCRPAHAEDLKKILAFCRKYQLPIIPRTAGTSLAGQVVGHGMVVDFSRHMNQILELNTDEKWVRVQPGVILDDLNRFLAPHGLFFGPETSTSNRCMIGGMVANNACGAHSLIYGSTRDHTLEISALLSDGSTVIFGPLNQETFRKKCVGSTLENRIYSQLFEMLSKKENQEDIKANYPDPSIKRRNTGYALDLLLNTTPFGGDETFNMCKILCGAEGTLAMYTEIKLNLVPLPPPEKALVCVHVKDINEAVQANLVALQYGPVAVELVDKNILDCTKANIQQAKNRFFIKGDPGAIMVVEFAFEKRDEAIGRAEKMKTHLRKKGLGYHYPVLFDNDIDKVWALRKAGLGLLSNMPGDSKAVAVIEDTAVKTEALPDYIREVQTLLDKLQLQRVFFAHIGTGELHIRPIVNLKNRTDVERFYQAAEGMARLVKKYGGSLSGEHGDGRLRGAFIPLVLGEECAALLKTVKITWDPQHLLNPGKITDCPPIIDSLRYKPGQREKKLKTYFNYDKTLGFLRAVEQCNGSGDCRKPLAAGGVMCPSYQATLDEFDSTRGRANILREFISYSPKKNPFDHRELIDVLDLCLSCKACKAECPSNVDMGKYKAEVLQHYYDAHGAPLSAMITGAYARFNKIGSMVPVVYNAFARSKITAPLIKKIMGFAKERKLPVIQKQSLREWTKKHLPNLNKNALADKRVLLFCDEFTNYNDTETGIRTMELLSKLGYHTEIPKHRESCRTYLSKGLLKKAAFIASENIRLLAPLVSEKRPLIGIEPSAILSFRDEYPDLVSSELRQEAINLAKNCYTVDEFIAKEYANGHIDGSVFDTRHRRIYLHGHCHQKALSSTDHTKIMLAIPENNIIQEIECGCCGMAGAFGFEKDHYKISMKIGELSLFPAIRKTNKDAIIVAAGTSCRQQILDGTGRKALHPAELLYQCLNGSSNT